MNEFFDMLFGLVNENGVVVMAHDSSDSDAIKFRCKFNDLLKTGNRDCTNDISMAMESSELNTIITSYESALQFPRLTNQEWLMLQEIKQADYLNDYTTYTTNLIMMKGLIEFVISDKLEAFTFEERNDILHKMRETLEENNYQFKSLCKIQVALSPNHTLEFKDHFLALKEKIERPFKAVNITDTGLSVFATSTDTDSSITAQNGQTLPSLGH